MCSTMWPRWRIKHTDKDILRLYEIWLKTGSPRAFGILQRLGVAPVNAGRKEH